MAKGAINVDEVERVYQDRGEGVFRNVGVVLPGLGAMDGKEEDVVRPVGVLGEIPWSEVT